MEIKRMSFSGASGNVETVNRFIKMQHIAKENVISITESGQSIVLYYWE